jgi:nucleoside-diphosphate-sugar epimerase
MRALVTGAAGFIGSTLSERLVATGHGVVGVDCFTDYYDRWRKQQNLAALVCDPRFRLEERDLSVDPLEDLLTGIDVVFHLAAQPGVRRSFGAGFEVYVRNNVIATQRLLEEAAQADLDAFVYASSSSVYGNAAVAPTPETLPRRPESPYGMTKSATEDLADLYHRVAGVPVVGLRYFTVYGPRQRPDMAFTRFIERALEGQPVTVLGDGHQLRDFTFVDDAVEATIAAAAHGRPGSVYNIGGGRPVELLAALHIIAGHCGGAEVEHRPVARGDVRATFADGGRARAELGTAPRVTLREGLRRHVSWARAQRAVAQMAA